VHCASPDFFFTENSKGDTCCASPAYLTHLKTLSQNFAEAAVLFANVCNIPPFCTEQSKFQMTMDGFCSKKKGFDTE
jgi:hypothetical protein